MKQSVTALLLAAAISLSSCAPTTTEKDGYKLLHQCGGPDLGYTSVSIIKSGGKYFKDIDRNGVLDSYEDWRLTPDQRAADLVARLSDDELAGLLVYSNIQGIPSDTVLDYEKVYIAEDFVRSINASSCDSKAMQMRWNNNIQALAEAGEFAIPVAMGSDPHNECTSDMKFTGFEPGEKSLWPRPLGLAAAFDPEIAREYAKAEATEYRALGLTAMIAPQVDIATDPRWWRCWGTFGEDPDLVTDYAKAYCEGLQTSDRKHRLHGSWGLQSVHAMPKHWYGYGAGEGGRDGHYGWGKYCVYPGNNLEEHKRAFVEGAFDLDGGTKAASMLMPVYDILSGPDSTGLGGSYSKFVVEQELRDKAAYDGLVITDWHITYDCNDFGSNLTGKPWGVEDKSIEERHLMILEAGVDQVGGHSESKYMKAAYALWTEKYGAKSARKRFEKSAFRVLRCMFMVGSFENPYLDVEKGCEIVGSRELMEAGYRAQQKSIVMLKNHVLPIKERLKVYVPQRYFPPVPGLWGGWEQEKTDWIISPDELKDKYDVVSTPEEADFALVAISCPSLQLGYDNDDVAKGGNGYVPISLQYGDYVAEYARAESLAGGDPHEKSVNRSYKGKTAKTLNYADADLVRSVKEAMGDKPVVVVVETHRPFVMSEIEPYADAILLSFEVQNRPVIDVISGDYEPSGLLPMQMPADMRTVEEQFEDVPHDMRCYVDADGNTYDFAFGLDLSGVISDSRTRKYKK